MRGRGKGSKGSTAEILSSQGRSVAATANAKDAKALESLSDKELLVEIYNLYQEIQKPNTEFPSLKNPDEVNQYFGLVYRDEIIRKQCLNLLLLMRNRYKPQKHGEMDMPVAMHLTKAFDKASITLLARQLTTKGQIETLEMYKMDEKPMDSRTDQHALYGFKSFLTGQVDPISPMEKMSLAYVIDDQNVLRFRQGNHIHAANFADFVKLSGTAYFRKEKDKEGWVLTGLDDETGAYHLNFAKKVNEKSLEKKMDLASGETSLTVENFDAERFEKYRAYAEKTVAGVGIPPSKLSLHGSTLSEEYQKAKRPDASPSGAATEKKPPSPH